MQAKSAQDTILDRNRLHGNKARKRQARRSKKEARREWKEEGRKRSQERRTGTPITDTQIVTQEIEFPTESLPWVRKLEAVLNPPPLFLPTSTRVLSRVFEGFVLLHRLPPESQDFRKYAPTEAVRLDRDSAFWIEACDFAVR